MYDDAPAGQPLFSDDVLRQKTEIPDIYGNVDFGRLPERFTSNPADQSQISKKHEHLKPEVLANAERLEVIRNHTMLGDRVADAYAALIPTYGFRKLVTMLETACAEGLDAVPDAPEELVRFIRSMEATPEWVDMDLVEEGARQERNAMAHLAPYAIRGAFIATFMNKYSALPMAQTGTLSNETSAKRVFETASFFTSTIMPGALTRYGAGFRAAAKVRLMHSMVRFNIMRANQWDVATYGIPIPQVDQMPAGLFGVFLLSFKLLEEGRTEFTAAERAQVEISRYRCFLLGLPEALLGETPQEIADLMLMRSATLRHEYDDRICGDLVRATMTAELSKDKSLGGRINTWMERGFSKTYFINNFCNANAAEARAIGIPYGIGDRVATVATLVTVLTRMGVYNLAMRLPGLKDAANKRLVGKLAKLLDSYGHADFITDAEAYRPVPAE